MITVNLLPETYRKPKVSSIEQFPRSPLAILMVSGLAVVGVLLWGMLLIRQAHLAQLTGRIQKLEPQKTSADELKASVQKLRDQHAVFKHLAHERSEWARHLNRLSDVTPEGVWLTDLSLDHEKGLVIQGSAIGEGGAEMPRIHRLVEGLKTDATFSAAINDIQIESIKSVQDNDLEIIEFTLTGGLGTSPPSGTKP